MDYNSQIGQDKFVLEVLRRKRYGTFVDIGCGHPVKINNTYILETQYEWDGVSLDSGNAFGCKNLSDDQYRELWKNNRTTPLVITNAVTVDFNALFKQHDLPEVIDYLDLDIEPPKATLECLLRIPFDSYKFRVITFEHDNYRDKTNRKPARDFLLGLGYRYVQSEKPCQEDWYILTELL
jgi:hypothetical protein